MAYNFDPDQSVSLVAIFLFINAAFLGFPMLSVMVRGGAPSIELVLLIAALIAAGVGLLQGRRWGWYLAVVAVGLSILFTLVGLLAQGLFGLLIDAGIIFLLTRPATRAKFGVR
jgi:hypothetical protein